MNSFFVTSQSSMCHWFYFMQVAMLNVKRHIQCVDDFGNLVNIGSESTRRSLQD